MLLIHSTVQCANINKPNCLFTHWFHYPAVYLHGHCAATTSMRTSRHRVVGVLREYRSGQPDKGWWGQPGVG